MTVPNQKGLITLEVLTQAVVENPQTRGEIEPIAEHPLIVEYFIQEGSDGST